MGKRKSKKKSSSSQSQPQHSESEKKRKNNKNDTFFLVDHKRKKKKYESSKHSNTPIVLMESVVRTNTHDTVLNFNEFPNDVIVVVLSFIPTYLLLRNFRLVNRNFAIMAMHAIEKYQFSDHFYVSDKKLENLSQDEVHNLFTKFHSCKRMTVQGDMHCVHSMELPFHKLQNLTYLDCYDIPVSFSEEIIQSNLVNTLVKLKIFTIFTNMPLLLRLKNLQDLSVKLDDSDDLKPLNLEGVPESVNNLRYLKVVNSHCCECSELIQIISYCHQLNTLELFNFGDISLGDRVSINVIKCIKSNLPNLRKFCYRYNADNVAFEEMHTIPSTLECLKLDSLSLISPESLVNMKHLTSLTQLSLDTALKRDTFSEALLSMIYSYQHLEKLSLLLKIEGSNFSVNIPPKELPNLKSLRITFTEDVFTRKEQCISKMLIPLEAFELCTNIEVLKIHNQTSKNVVIDWNSLRPFTKLKKLELTCDKMIGWDVANQVLPRLENLTLYVSQGIDGSLESLPDTIQYLDIDATIELESNKFLRRLPAMTALSTLKFSMEGVSTSLDLIFPCSLVQLQISHLTLRKGEQTFSNFLFSLRQLETLKILDSVVEDLYGLLKSILILKHSIRKVYIEKSESANIDSVRNSKSQAKLNIGHPVLKEYDQSKIFLTLSGFAWKQHSLLNQYSCIEFM